MKTLSEVIVEFEKTLKKKLGDRYEVDIGRKVWSDFSGDIPDVVIQDRNSGRRYFIEFKGNSPEEDIPFATLSGLLKMAEMDDEEKPEVFFVTSARVVPLQEELLRRKGIRLVKATQPLVVEAGNRLLDLIARKIQSESFHAPHDTNIEHSHA